jgi:hypothetical protein
LRGEPFEEPAGDVDAGCFLEGLPAWDGVDLDDETATGVVVQQVDTGEVGAGRIGSCERESLFIGCGLMNFCAARASDVGAVIVVGVPADRADDLATQHEHSDVVAGMADELLQVEN